MLPVVMLEFEAPYSMGLGRMREFIVFFLIECIYVAIKFKKKKLFCIRFLNLKKKRKTCTKCPRLLSYLQPWTKSVKNFTLSYSQKTHPVNLASWWPLSPPLPGQCC